VPRKTGAHLGGAWEMVTRGMPTLPSPKTGGGVWSLPSVSLPSLSLPSLPAPGLSLLGKPLLAVAAAAAAAAAAWVAHGRLRPAPRDELPAVPRAGGASRSAGAAVPPGAVSQRDAPAAEPPAGGAGVVRWLGYGVVALGVPYAARASWAMDAAGAAEAVGQGVVLAETALLWALGLAVRLARGRFRGGAAADGAATAAGRLVAGWLVGDREGVEWERSRVLDAEPAHDFGQQLEHMRAMEGLRLLYPGEKWQDLPKSLLRDTAAIRREIRQERSLAWAMARPVSQLSRALADPRLRTLPGWAKSLVSGTVVRAGRVRGSPLALLGRPAGGVSLSEAGEVVLDLRQVLRALVAAGLPPEALDDFPASPEMAKDRLNRVSARLAVAPAPAPGEPPARPRQRGPRGPRLWSRLLCLRDSQPRLCGRPDPEFVRTPVDWARGGCLGHARLVSVGTSTDVCGTGVALGGHGIPARTAVRAQAGRHQITTTTRAGGPGEAEFLVTGDGVQAVASVADGDVTETQAAEVAEAYLCLCVAHQLVHRAYDWAWVLARLVTVRVASNVAAGAAGALGGLAARLRAPGPAVTLGAVALAVALQALLARLLRPAYEGWVAARAARLCTAAGYPPDILQGLAASVEDRSRRGVGGVFEQQLLAGVLCPCSARGGAALLGPSERASVRCEARAKAGIDGVGEGEYPRAVAVAEAPPPPGGVGPGLLNIAGGRQQQALRWMAR